MGVVWVEGLGEVPIKGDMPDAAEEAGIGRALQEVMKGWETIEEPAPEIPQPQMDARAEQRAEDNPSGEGGLPKWVDPALVTAGATGGAALTSFTGPGMAGGAVIGAGVGKQAANTADSLYRAAHGQPPKNQRFEREFEPGMRTTHDENGVPQPAPDHDVGQAPPGKMVNDMLAPLAQTAEEMAWEAGGGTVGTLLKYPLAGMKNIGKRLFGLNNDKSRDLAFFASKHGIPLGPSDASGFDAVQGATKLAVLPMIGGLARAGKKATLDATKNWHKRTLLAIGPTSTMGNVAEKWWKSSSGKFTEFQKKAATKYEKFYQLADGLKNPNIVPTLNMKKAAQSILDEYSTRFLPLADGTVEKVQLPAKTISWLSDIVKAGESITPRQYRAKMEDMVKIISHDVDHGVQGSATWFAKMKPAMEADWLHPVIKHHAEPNGQKAVQALQDANAFFNKGMKPFETTTAGKFGSVEKGVFGAGTEYKAAAKQADTEAFFKTLMDNRSVTGIKELKSILGDGKKFREGVSTWVDRAMKNSAVPESKADMAVFDPKLLKKHLGLDGGDGERALEEMLKGTGVDVQDFKEFVQVVEASGKVKIPATSTFLQRRVTLGGASALWSAAALGQASVPGTLTALLLMRKAGGLLMSPGALQSLTKSFDDSLSNQERRKFFMRAARHAFGYNANATPTKEDEKWAEIALEEVISAGGAVVDASRAVDDTFVAGHEAGYEYILNLGNSLDTSVIDKINRINSQ